MHDLDKWIIDKGVSRKSIANDLKISEATLSRYLSGERIPKPEIMNKIVNFTDGQIKNFSDRNIQ